MTDVISTPFPGVLCGVRFKGAAVALLVLWGQLSAAPSLREVLTTEEFNRGGLQKLTEAELAFLSERLLGAPSTGQLQAVVDTPVASTSSDAPLPELLAGDSAFGREEELYVQVAGLQKVPKEIQSRIDGLFTGWNGRTVFTLSNRQVWRQVEPGEFTVNLNSPVVTIRKGLFGVFYLRVQGYGSQVKVKRLK